MKPTRFLDVRITHSLLGFMMNADVEVLVDASPVGSGSLTTSYFSFTWAVGSGNPAQLETFTLKPQKAAAIGNRYDVISGSGEVIATVRDLKHALFETGTTTEFEGGHLRMTETTKSNFLGMVNLGMSREFVLEGSAEGKIEVSDIFGQYGFRLVYTGDSDNPARLNAILSANLILLTRAIAEHHRT
jgi:hypothetical protein